MYARPSWKPTLDAALPYSVKTLIQSYRMARGGEFYVEIPLMPPSSNKLYGKFSNNKKFYLDPKVKAFRDMTDASCWGKTFVPKGTLAAVIAIESPGWLSMEYKIRVRDIDNPIKTLLDAVQRTLGFNDTLIWEVHSAKIFSRRESTHLWLFDLGDVVTAIGGPR